MWKSITHCLIGALLFAIPGIMPISATTGGVDCDTSKLHLYPCSESITGCSIGQINKCHSLALLDDLCDEQGGGEECSNEMSDPDCTGHNADELDDSIICKEKIGG